MKIKKVLVTVFLSLSVFITVFIVIRNNYYRDDNLNSVIEADSIFITEGAANTQETIINTEAVSLSNNPLPEDELQTFFGSGELGNEDGRALDTQFALPSGLCFDNDGYLIVFDTFNSGVKRISNLESQTILGLNVVTDEFGFAAPAYLDGPRLDALFGRPYDGVYSANGDLFIVDSVNHAIRLLRDGHVYTFVGGTQGSTDGKYGSAKFDFPSVIAIDKDGNLYVADTMNHTIRKVDPDGNVTTIAGRPGTSGHTDGEGRSARFNEPSGIAVDDNGVIYVADTGNHLIRKIENGRVTTIAGVFEPIPDDEDYALGGYEDGPAESAQFSFPQGLYFTNDVLFIADTGNHMIRALTPSGNVITVAGNGEPGDADGPPDEAMLNKPTGVAHSNGKLYIADSLNNKIKVISVDTGNEVFR